MPDMRPLVIFGASRGVGLELARLERAAGRHVIAPVRPQSDIAALDEVLRLKRSASKGRYLKKIVVSTTTGPGIPVDPAVTRNFSES